MITRCSLTGCMCARARRINSRRAVSHSDLPVGDFTQFNSVSVQKFCHTCACQGCGGGVKAIIPGAPNRSCVRVYHMRAGNVTAPTLQVPHFVKAETCYFRGTQWERLENALLSWGSPFAIPSMIVLPTDAPIKRKCARVRKKLARLWARAGSWEPHGVGRGGVSSKNATCSQSLALL